MPKLNPSDYVDDVQKFLRLGMEEIGAVAHEEFDPFVLEYGPMIADLAARTVAGDNAAKVSLDMLRQQVLTHAYIAKLKAQGVAMVQVQTVIGLAIRVALTAMA